MDDQSFFELVKNITSQELNEVQKQAILEIDVPTLLLASPGSGKTTTLISKIAYLILVKDVKPEEILAVTFSRSAAHDMLHRFELWFGAIIPQKVHLSTIHSLSFQITRDLFKESGLTFEVIDGISQKDNDDWETSNNKRLMLRSIFQQINGEAITEDQMDELITMIGYVKNKLLKNSELEAIDTIIPHFPEIYQAYENRKKENTHHRLIDFDDMLLYALYALRKRQSLRNKYQAMFHYILSDETQDTSLVQYQIIECLSNSHQNIYMVGDEDQSLFSFRGVDIKKILDFQTQYPNGKVLTLEQNYRSSETIVRLANQFIKRNKLRYEKNMFTNNGTGEPIIIKSLGTEREQISYLIKKIETQTNYAEIAVLYRVNQSSILMMHMFDKQKIPFYMKDHEIKFFRHWVLKDVLNIIKFAYNPNDLELFKTISTKLNLFLSRNHWLFIESHKEKGILKALQSPTLEMKDYQRNRIELLDRLMKGMKSNTATMAIQVIEHQMGYGKTLTKIAKRYGFREDSLYEILEISRQIAQDYSDPKAFVHRLEELPILLRASRKNKYHNAVTFSTFHSAKGLEFDHVFMIDLLHGILPTESDFLMQKEGNNEPLEESARLFYVGMTRARHRLELLYPKIKYRRVATPSLFIKEIESLQAGTQLKQKSKLPITKEAKKKTELPPLVLEKGDAILHHDFGNGIVTNVNDQFFTAVFGKVEKKLSIKICSEKQLITKNA